LFSLLSTKPTESFPVLSSQRRHFYASIFSAFQLRVGIACSRLVLFYRLHVRIDPRHYNARWRQLANTMDHCCYRSRRCVGMRSLAVYTRRTQCGAIRRPRHVQCRLTHRGAAPIGRGGRSLMSAISLLLPRRRQGWSELQGNWEGASNFFGISGVSCENFGREVV